MRDQRSLLSVVISGLLLFFAACGEPEEVGNINSENEGPPDDPEQLCGLACERVYHDCEQIFLYDDNSAMSEAACVQNCLEEDLFHGGEWCVATEAECMSQPPEMVDECIPDDYHPPACDHLGAWDHDVAATEQKVVELINDLRAEGTDCPGTGSTMPPVGPIEMDRNLQCASRLHSLWMEDNVSLSHTGEGGSDAGDRAWDAGYHWTGIGENIAQGSQTAEQVVELWRNSDDGHCENMMAADWDDAGVGMYRFWWTLKVGAQ